MFTAVWPGWALNVISSNAAMFTAEERNWALSAIILSAAMFTAVGHGWAARGLFCLWRVCRVMST
eukprot:746244-Karenia_brevis.AAC.1